ncbi:related to mitochondrial ribosomal protein [Fusarium proliferatum]|nr:related to mitochondrial ribosomal protein [Fusarium proliferatum]
MFSATRALRQAAVHAERTPLIKFLGPRTIPSNVDHTPKPHPASGVEKLPESWSGYGNGDAATTHKSFSSYRDHVQQHGPLQKSGFGGTPAASLGSVKPPQGVAFDVSELPTRFHRAPLNAAEIEAIESICPPPQARSYRWSGGMKRTKDGMNE